MDARRPVKVIDSPARRGVVLLKAIPALLREETPLAVAQQLLCSWQADLSGDPHGEIPLRIASAALAWRADRDQAHILHLPPEQRAILIDLIDFAEGRARDEYGVRGAAR